MSDFEKWKELEKEEDSRREAEIMNCINKGKACDYGICNECPFERR